MNLKRMTTLFASTAMMATLLTGCGGDSNSNSLTVGVTEMKGNFSPVYYESSYDGWVSDLVFEKLVDYNYDGVIEGKLAESFEESEDKKTITFKLRKDAKFSDGEPVTADDVVFTYKVLADPSYDGRYGTVVQDMVGYCDAYDAEGKCSEGYFSGKDEDAFKGVEKVDDYTVKFNFTKPQRVNIESAIMGILPEHVYPDVVYNNVKGIQKSNQEPIGSGPYVLVEHKNKQYASLTKNEHYAGEGYAIENVVLKVVETTTDYEELKKGDIDYLPGVIETDKITKGQANKDLNVQEYARSGYGYIGFNCQNGATADARVRRALVKSFDIDSYIKADYYDKENDLYLATKQVHPYSQISWAVKNYGSSADYDKLLPDNSFNMAEADKLLVEAGWVMKDGKRVNAKGEQLTLNILSMPKHPVLLKVVPMWNKAWGEELGIKINVSEQEFNTVVDIISANASQHVNEWNIFFLAASVPSPDPDSVRTTYHSSEIYDGGSNMSRYSNPTVDKLLDEARVEADLNKASEKYLEIAKILAEDSPECRIYANTYFDISNKKVKNLKVSSLYEWPKGLKDATIE